MDFVISEGYKREGRGVTDIDENPYRGLYPRRGLYARVYGICFLQVISTKCATLVNMKQGLSFFRVS